MKRILVYGMTDNPGGIETYLLNLARRMKGRLILDFVSDFPAVAHRAELERLGSRIYFIPPKGKHLLGHWRALWRLLRAHSEYHCVYFNLLDAGGAITALVPWLLGRRIVAHSHNGNTDKPLLHRLCRPLLCVMTDGFAACSRLAAAHLFGAKREVLLVPNAIDTASFLPNEKKRAEMRQKLGISKRPVVCHIGRLSMQKNPFGLLEIFKALLQREPEAILLSVGSGELEQEVQAYAKRLGIAGQVRFLGRRADIADLLQAADVFLLPSFYEGLPIVLIEAQAAGLPCAASDRITREADLTGDLLFLSPEQPPAVWAEVLLRLLKEKRKNNRQKLIRAGYDQQFCGWIDDQLLALFGEEG